MDLSDVGVVKMDALHQTEERKRQLQARLGAVTSGADRVSIVFQLEVVDRQLQEQRAKLLT